MNTKCPNKQRCGSCTWSDIPYKEQLNKKISLINTEFKNNNIEHEVKKIIPSPKTQHYRNRMDFVINFEGKFGLREKGKWWRVIDNHKCFLSHNKIEKAFDNIYDWTQETDLSFYDRKLYRGILRYAVIRATKKGEILVNIITSEPDDDFPEAKIISQLEKLESSKNIDNLLWLVNKTRSDTSFGELTKIIKGNPYIIEEILEYKYKISPNSFFQTNPYAAEELLKTVLGYSKNLDTNNIFLDLYCGSGFFTVPLSKKFPKIHGIEISPEAISDAEENKKLNNSASKFQTVQAEDLSWKDLNAGQILLDPPRSGLHPKVLQTLLDNPPKNMIYVSCNYKKFASEFKSLSEKYKIKNTTAVDMFPHTPHVELVILLEKR
jgi:23S rRNA (uracil-5-)-methyltransferase RumA